MEAYWARADPLWVDGPGAESFAGFMGRVRAALTRLAQLPAAQVALFGHGQFMQAMRAFRCLDLERPIGNAEGFGMSGQGQRWRLD